MPANDWEQYAQQPAGGGGGKWDQYAQPSQSSAPVSTAPAAPPTDTPDNGWRGQIEKFGSGAAQGLMQPFMHPLKTLGSMAETTPAGSLFDMATGRPDATQQMAKGLVQGFRSDPARAAGQLAGGFAGAHVLPAMSGAAGSAMDTLQPRSSSSVVPPVESAARKLTTAISPDTSKASQYIKASQQEVPSILGYAKRQGNPLKTQLEFSKAAQGNAQEVQNHYQNNILGPNADEHVPVPAGYGGKSYTATGENPRTTARLGDVNDRIVQINKELAGPSSKLNEGDQRSALASKSSLQAEHGQLTDLLHRSLSNLTGVAPEEIGNLRQRMGRSYELANDTNAAVTKRGLQEGKPAGSASLPTTMGDLAMHAINKLRGGPTAIADRSFQGAIKNFPGSEQSLPQPIYPQNRPSGPGLLPPMDELPSTPAGGNYATRGQRLQMLAKKKGLVP